MNVGSVQSQVSMKMLELKWQKKKNDINTKKKEGLTQAELLMQSFEEQAEDVRNSKDSEAIYTKLKMGGTLSADEINYLKQHDPEALADYEKAQAEKQAYKNALKNCKTKEEVNRLNLNRMGGYISRAKAIANDPYIPEGKKLELMNKLNNEVCLTRDAHEQFVQEGAYEKLPEEAEIAKERAKEQDVEHDAVVKEQMEAAKELDEEAKEIAGEDSGENHLLQNEGVDTENRQDLAISTEATVKREKFEQKTHTDNGLKNVKTEATPTSIAREQLTFDKISKDIERQIIKLGSSKSRFEANI